MSWTETYDYAPIEAYDLRTDTTVEHVEADIASSTTYNYAVQSNDGAVAAAAISNNQVSLLENVTKSYGPTTSSLAQVGSTETTFSAYDTSGTARSVGYSDAVLRPHLVWVAGTDPDDKVLVNEYKTYTPFGAERVIRRHDDPADVFLEYDADRVTAVSYLNYATSADYYGMSSRAKYSVNEQGQRVDYEYDGLGRLSSAIERGGARVTTYTYGMYSHAVVGGRNWRQTEVSVEPTGSSLVETLTERIYYNGLRRPIQTVRADQLDVGGDLIDDLGYDDLGRLTHRYDTRTRVPSAGTSYSSPDGALTAVETYSYAPDPLNRKSATTRPLYGTTATTYGASAGEHGLPAGAYRRTTVIDAEGLATATYSDVLGRPVHRSTNATSVRSHYDALGRLDKVYRAWPDESMAHTISYTYDAFGRRTAQTIPEEGTRNTVYDRRGRIVAEQGPHERVRGFARGFHYDAYGELTETGKLPGLPSDGDEELEFTALISKTIYNRGLGTARFGTIRNAFRYTADDETLRENFYYDGYGRLNRVYTYDGARHHGGANTYSYYRRYGYDQLDQLTLDTQRDRVGGGQLRRSATTTRPVTSKALPVVSVLAGLTKMSRKCRTINTAAQLSLRSAATLLSLVSSPHTMFRAGLPLLTQTV